MPHLYLKCGVVGRKIEQRMSVTKMRVLTWMSGVTRENRIRSENVKGSISVVSIVEKIGVNRQVIRACYI